MRAHIGYGTTNRTSGIGDLHRECGRETQNVEREKDSVNCEIRNFDEGAGHDE